MTPLLLDEMLGGRLAEALRRHDMDVRALVETADQRGLPDEEVLAMAAAEQRVVLTANVPDFLRLDREWRREGRSHAGILLVPSYSFPQDGSLTGALTGAVLRAQRNDLVPQRDVVGFLSPGR